MDPVRMAIIHSGAGALAAYIVAFYNLGLSLLNKPAYKIMNEDNS